MAVERFGLTRGLRGVALALFAGAAAAFGANEYTGANNGDWFVEANWSLGRVPTSADDVEIASKTVSATGSITAASITLSSATLSIGSETRRPHVSATVAGDFTLSGASKLYVYAGELSDYSVFADNGTAIAAISAAANVVSVGGALTVGGTSVVYPDAAILTGVPVVFRVGTFSLAEGASFNVTKHGWGWSADAWTGAPQYAKPRKTEGGAIQANGWTFAIGSGLSYGTGGSYGGKGRGTPSTWQGKRYGDTYGYDFAPFLPGSPAGFYQSVEKSRGPGSVVVLASGAATVNGAVVADGTQHVSGSSYDHSGTSGGGIWLAASSFAFGPGARLSARGGGPIASGSYAPGGGGRIAVAEGCTPAELDAMMAGTLPSRLGRFSLDAFDVARDVSCGTNKTTVSTKGTDGTAVFVAPTTSAAVLDIQSNVPGLSAEGVDFGETACRNGAYSFTAPVHAFLEADDGVRYSCAGFVVSNATGQVAAGPGRTAAFTVDGASGPYSLTWLWDSRAVRASCYIVGSGTVTVQGATYGENFQVFIPSGVATAFEATSGAEGRFSSWFSPVLPDGGLSEESVVAPVATASFDIIVTFVAGRLSRVWTNANGTGDWHDGVNWDPPGIPSINDDVFATNATITATRGITAGSLTLAGASSFIVQAAAAPASDAASLYAAATVLAVAGSVEIGDTTVVTLKNDPVTGAAPKFVCGDFHLGPDARISADGRGWFWFESAEPALGTSGVYRTWAPGRGNSFDQGAGHGGLGGGSTAPYGRTYGSAYAPFLPGSPNGLYNNSIGNGHPGGGTVWIVCTNLCEIEGSVTADGEKSYYGASSGGGVWIAARGLSARASASITANGGSLDAGYGSMGAGGRISLALGLTEAQLDALAAGETPDALAYSDGAALIDARASGGCRIGAPGYAYGRPGTVTTVSGALAFTDVAVVGSPVRPDGVSPYYGHHACVPGSTRTFTAPQYGFDAERDGVRYACVGYVVSNATAEIASGSGLSVEVAVGAVPLTVTWLWGELQSRTVIRKPANGTLLADGVAAPGDIAVWASDAPPAVTVAPDSGYAFVCWEGNVPFGRAWDNPLVLDAGVAYDLTPVLRLDEAAATRTWSGTGRWTDAAKWSPAGNIPGPDDAVVIASGTCRVSNALAVASLQMTGGTLAVGAVGDVNPELAVAGDAALSGGTVNLGFGPLMTGHARLAAGGGLALSGTAKINVYGGPVADAFTFVSGCSFVDVGGALTLDGTSTLSLFSDYLTGGSVKVAAGSVAVGASATIEANEKGYMWLDSTTPPDAPGLGFSYNYGGSHGGVGGGWSTPNTYGQRLAPVQPGSPNGCYQGYGDINRGGGLVRIHAAGTIAIDGTVSANAKATGSYGGGSGGGIWLTAHAFAFGADAALTARGGRSNYSSKGGGGRIALGWQLTEAQIEALAATGGAGLPAARELDEAAFRERFGNGTMTVDVGSIGDSTPARIGTFVFLDAKKYRTMLLLK